MESLYYRRSATTATAAAAAAVGIRPTVPGGIRGSGDSGAHPPPIPQAIATYSSLPPTHLLPPLLPLPFSRSTSLPSPSPPCFTPPHRRRRPKSKPENHCRQNQARLFSDGPLVESPPPSSLPLPTFSLKPKPTPPAATAEAHAGGPSGEELSRLLRL